SLRAKALGLVLAAAFASPVSAASEPKTRLVSCDAGNCLLVTGRRADVASTVTINGHAVAVQGARTWRASLPVDTVRAWSAPFARTITVSVVEGGARERALAEADLPIGLLGHVDNLDMLVVSVK
ncbi:MAG: hypothetical protein JWR77_795, partial [Rhizorhabdus sp.]|nr:hypothetical protein [Rhizorhabdus sp.]